MVGIKKKTERREATRETKALRAAKLEKSIEKELLDRLKRGAYGDAPLNVNEDVWNAVLENAQARIPDADGNELELEEDLTDEEAEEDIDAMDAELRAMDDDDAGQREFVSDDEDSDDDIEDWGSVRARYLHQDMPSDEDEDDGGDDSESPPKAKRGTKRAAPRRPDPRGKKGTWPRLTAGRPRVEIEYEQETEPLTAEQLAQW